MKSANPVTFLAVALAFLSISAKSLDGTWCFREEGLVLTFFGADSVRVSSENEEGISGLGTFAKKDTAFEASITNDGLVIKLGYRYDWVNDTLITARTLFISVNGDTVNNPTEPFPMVKCGPGGPAAPVKK